MDGIDARRELVANLLARLDRRVVVSHQKRGALAVGAPVDAEAAGTRLLDVEDALPVSHPRRVRRGEWRLKSVPRGVDVVGDAGEVPAGVLLERLHHGLAGLAGEDL